MSHKVEHLCGPRNSQEATGREGVPSARGSGNLPQPGQKSTISLPPRFQPRLSPHQIPNLRERGGPKKTANKQALSEEATDANSLSSGRVFGMAISAFFQAVGPGAGAS